MQKECENEMEKLLNDVDEALDLLTENRMAEIWKDNVKLKELSEQMAEAERKYQELDLPEKIKSAIDDLMMSSGRLGSYCEKMLYRQGLLDGCLLMKHIERHRTILDS